MSRHQAPHIDIAASGNHSSYMLSQRVSHSHPRKYKHRDLNSGIADSGCISQAYNHSVGSTESSQPCDD